MGKHERPEFRRDPSEYSIRDMCGLARDLLQKHGENTTQEERREFSWDSALGHFALCSRTLDTEFPVYQLMANDDRLINDSHKIYLFSEANRHVHIYEDDEQYEPENPLAYDFLVKDYLASNPNVTEPLISHEGAKRFNHIAAHFAIQAALEAGEINLSFQAQYYDRPEGTFFLDHATHYAEKHGVTIDDMWFPYSRSRSDMFEALCERVESFRPNQILPPSSVTETNLDTDSLDS